MLFLSDLRIRLARSKRAYAATDEILSLLKEAGLNKIPFAVEFLDDDEIAITLIRDTDEPRRKEFSSDDELNVMAIASIFGNVAARRGLSFRPGAKIDFGWQHDH